MVDKLKKMIIERFITLHLGVGLSFVVMGAVIGSIYATGCGPLWQSYNYGGPVWPPQQMSTLQDDYRQFSADELPASLEAHGHAHDEEEAHGAESEAAH